MCKVNFFRNSDYVQPIVFLFVNVNIAFTDLVVMRIIWGDGTLSSLYTILINLMTHEPFLYFKTEDIVWGLFADLLLYNQQHNVALISGPDKHKHIKIVPFGLSMLHVAHA